jgi:hypothetical protein
VYDASRFLSYHAETISFNALHIYHSALPFTPTGTQLRKNYAHELETSVKVLHGVKWMWDPTVMVIRCKAPVCSISFSPNGRFIAAAGSNRIEIRDALIGSSAVSIDLPKPLFYVSSYTDEVRVGDRLKELVRRPFESIVGPRVVGALKDAENIASLAPVLGLENVLGSVKLQALIHAEYNPERDPFIDIMKKLESRIRLFTAVVLLQIKQRGPNGVPHQVMNDLEELRRQVQDQTFIPVTDHF